MIYLDYRIINMAYRVIKCIISPPFMVIINKQFFFCVIMDYKNGLKKVAGSILILRNVK